MIRVLFLLVIILGLSACEHIVPAAQKSPKADQRPVARPTDLDVPKAKAPSQTAKTAEQFDTTTAEDRAKVEKAAATSASEKRLGTTIASLGDPADPGFWLETALVDKVQPGRVSFPISGKSAVVELRPIDGPPTSGSLISLPAMRVLEAPLGGLPKLEVFAR